MLKMVKSLVAVALCAVISCGFMAGCDNKQGGEINEDGLTYKNFEEPKVGEDVIKITVKGYDDPIIIKLFPDVAPKACENFFGLAERGYYDGVIFHRIIEDFMVQGGDPEGTGFGGESLWGEGIPQENSDKLRHFAGTISYATTTVNPTNKSQFFIVTGKKSTEQDFALYEQNNKIFPKDVQEKYIEVGGAPFLDGDYTAFGQVIEGLDVVMEISRVDTVKDRPKTDVVMEKVEVIKYE